MFESDPVYNLANPITGIQGWFFIFEEDEVGPFPSREAATKEYERYLELKSREPNDADQSSDGKTKLSLSDVHLDSSTNRRSS